MSGHFSPGLAWKMPLSGRRLIEASAGTGKTHTIADLVLRLLLGDALAGAADAVWDGPVVTIDHLLVVTFTNAAAAELRERVRRRLRDAAAALEGEGVEQDKLWPWLRDRLDQRSLEQARERLRQALVDFDLARISTIHGFCQTILRERALATGIGLEDEVIGADEPRLERIARDYWLQTIGAPSADQRLVDACASILGANAVARLVALGREALRQRHDQPLVTLPRAPMAEQAELVRQWFQQFLDMLNTRWDHERQAARALTYGDLPRTLERALAADRALAAKLRARFPVALVDEFQDTDSVQWAIFERIWPRFDDPDFDGASPSLLAMIGDPKQAIYRFRGGDIHTYMAARGKIDGEPLALDVNWRSDHGLVEALQAWLGRPEHGDCFGRGIRWSTVCAQHATRLGPDGAPAVVLDWTAEKFNVGAIPPVVVGWVREILDRDRLEVDGRRLGFGDIAVLVPTASKGRAVHAALTAAGIPAALQTRSSVFSLPVAGHLLELLRGVLAPEDAAALSAALATPIVGRTVSALRADRAEDRAWRGWIEGLAAIRQRWRHEGPGPAFSQLLDRWPVDEAGRSIRERVLTWPDGLRVATDLQHLLDLLVEQAYLGHLGPAALVRWFEQRIAGVADEEVAEDTAQLRLERAGGAVKILTVHASKGLEFPVVLLPYLSAAKRGGRDRFPWTHPVLDGPNAPRTGVWLAAVDPGKGSKADAWQGEGKDVRARIADEEMAEEHRLLYVALTRAVHQVRMFWCRSGSSKSRALSQRIIAVIAGSPAAEVNSSQRKDPSKKNKKGREDNTAKWKNVAAVFAALEQQLGAAGWQIRPWSGGGDAADLASAKSAAAVGVDQAEPLVRSSLPDVPGRYWRQHSFSSLQRGGRRADDRGFGTAAQIDEAEADAGPLVEGRASIWPAGFGGMRAGLVVHELLEEAWREPALLRAMCLDEGWREGSPASGRLRAALRRHGFAGDPALVEPLGRCLRGALTAPIPLDTDGPPLRLGELDHPAVPELGFLAPLRGEASAAEGWRTRGLAKRLRKAAAGDGEAERLSAWIADALGVEGRAVEGMLVGFIDLLFEHRGRLWLLDWKTNRLPEAPDAGARVMAESGYGLQALLYALAARRLLALRGRDPDRDFGGILYVFLRAFGGGDSEAAVGRGVVCLRPGPAWLAAAERELLAPGEVQS